MRAVRLHAPGGIDGLRLDEVSVPAAGEGELLVRVQAAAITRDELDWPTDRLPAVPSYELSGVVEGVGEGVSEFEVGDGVFALTPFDRDGVAAELAVVPAGVVAHKPARLDHVESASLPMPGLTAWQALFDHGGLVAGERVLIHGANGGVGHIAMQLAQWKGADATGEPGDGQFDLVFDTAGGERLAGSPALLREGGRLVSVADEPPAGTGTYFVVEPSAAQLGEIAGLADAGALRPAVDSTFALDDFREAFVRLTERGKRGKVVLRVGDSAS